MRRAGLALIVVVMLVGSGAACASEQEPQMPAPAQESPSTTSHPLAPCPPGGPDATTPPAGCLAEDGSVQRR